MIYIRWAEATIHELTTTRRSLPHIITLLENAKKKYKVYLEGAYATPDILKFGDVPHWIPEHQDFHEPTS